MTTSRAAVAPPVGYHAPVLPRFSLVLAALSLTACEAPPKPGTPPSQKDTKDGTADEPPAGVAKAVLAAPLLSAQQPAPLTIAIHPARWSALHRAAMPILSKLPEDAEPLRKASGPEALPGLVGDFLNLAAPPKLEGWDTSKPILIALGETDESGIAGATVGQLPLEQGWVPGIRHQAFIPATDHTALLASLSTILSAAGTPLPALAKGYSGAFARRIEDYSVVLLPSRKGVRVVVFDAYVGQSEEKAIAHMSKRLGAPIHVTSSAAASMLQDDAAVVSAWFRPDRLRSLGTSAGASQMFRALEHADPEMKAQMHAMGTSILLSSDAVMVDEGAEVDEIGLALVVDGKVLRLRQLAGLSDEGESAFAAATKDTSPTFAAAVKPAWADLVVRANLRALLDGAEPPAITKLASSPDAFVHVIREGGVFARLHMGTRHGFGLLRFAEQSMGGSLPIPTAVTPTAGHLLWNGMSGKDMPKVALALHWPKGHDISGLTTLAREMTKDPDFASLAVHATEYEGAPTHVLGFGGASQSAFAMDKSSAVDPLVELRVNVPVIISALGERGAGLGGAESLLAESSPMVLTVRHHSRALVSELAWAPGGGACESKPVPVAHADGTPKPIGNPATTEAERCVGTAAFAYSGVLRAAGTAAPDSLAEIVTKGLAEAGTAMACAAKSPEAKEASKGLRRVAVSALLDAIVDPKLQATVRKQQCAISKDEPFCAAAPAAASKE